MAVWIKMPLGREVGLSPGDIVLDLRWGPSSPSAPKKRRSSAPLFRLCLLWPNSHPSQQLQLLSSCNIGLPTILDSLEPSWNQSDVICVLDLCWIVAECMESIQLTWLWSSFYTELERTATLATCQV